MLVKTKVIPANLDIQYLYTYDELSEEVKEKMIKEYCESECQYEAKNYDIYELEKEDLQYNIFPESDIDISYSLGYSQSDYFIINGDISYKDILELIKDKFNDKEYKTLKFYIDLLDFKMNMPRHRKYYSKYDFDDMTYELENEYIRDINYELCERFSDLTYDFMYDFVKSYERDVREYIYNIPEEEAIEYYTCNFTYFDEEGNWIE